MRNLSLLAVIALLACNGDDKGGETGTPSTEDLDGDGYSPEDGDCDDADFSVNPGAEEVYCDGVDNDCVDGDDDDADGDQSLCEDDCDDADPTVFPGATDLCGDKVDSDCGGELECDCDADGYDGEQCDGADCDDLDVAINPDAEDLCYDGLDTNCDEIDDYDCDRDDHASAEYGGDDCDDDNYEISPSDAEICADGINNDCSDATPDCDCDGDGYIDLSCGGDDCDDTNAEISPVGDETVPNGADDDCDGEVDEDGYCNVYMPLANGSSALLSYITLLADGSTYTDDQTIDSWDEGSGEAVLSRALNSALSSWNIDEYWSCADGIVSMSGFYLETSGIPLFTAAYSEARVELLPESELVAGATWTISYTAEDSAIGTLWTVDGTATVIGTEPVEVEAGAFEALVVDYDYALIETGLGGTMSRAGTNTRWYVPRLGVVYAMDVNTDGAVVGERELVAYEGYHP